MRKEAKGRAREEALARQELDLLKNFNRTVVAVVR